MTPAEKIQAFLNDLAISIPLARGSGDEEQYLQALLDAALFFPVFAGWPSPVDEWLEEAGRISRQGLDTETQALLTVMPAIRRANVRMRRLELDSALALLDNLDARAPATSAFARDWAAITRARIFTRQHRFAPAQQLLAGHAPSAPEWLAATALLARGELQLEMNDLPAASATLKQALARLPFELIEEQVQARQCLAFVYISVGDARRALSHLDRARRILQGANVWSEVIQMNLAVGNLQLALGRTALAEKLFTEALQLCQSNPQPAIEAVLQLGLARANAGRENFEAAAAAALRAAQTFAAQGSALGYIGVISYLHSLYLQAGRHSEAYRVLAFGLSITRRLHLMAGEIIFRVQINRLRNEILGESKFDEMVRAMLATSKEAQGKSPSPGPITSS